MDSTDSIICSLLNQHHEKGMEYLFTRYYKPLVIWAVSFLKNIPQAEDLVQDFFIRLWEKENKYPLKPETFKSFLYTSIRNLAIDRMEKKDPLHRATPLVSLEKPWEEYDHLQEEILLQIRTEIDKLPERTKEVVRCIYGKGWSYKETAAHLGISVATVNTLLVQALKKLRQINPASDGLPLLLFLCIPPQLTDCFPAELSRNN